jgi:ferredoxin
MQGPVPQGSILAEASALFGVPLQMPCGGNGIYGKCKVRIEEGPCEALGITSSRNGLVQAESDFIGAEESAAGV